MKNKKIAITCCSNGQKMIYAEKISMLEKTLQDIGIEPVFSNCIYEREAIFGGTVKERAEALMNFYHNDDITEICDISGGDVANGILPYLDYKVIANSSKRFWGYSDLTTIVNGIYAKTGRESVLYQICNLIYDHKEQQIKDFRKALLEEKDDLFQLKYHFVQGNYMEGVVVGGNIRCFLKLAGTEFMPDLQDKILLLESYSGGVAKMETYLCQLQQLGAFDKISGILLGTFSEMDENRYEPNVVTLIQRIVGSELPIAVTGDIGHGTDSKAIVIGENMMLKKFIEVGQKVGN